MSFLVREALGTVPDGYYAIDGNIYNVVTADGGYRRVWRYDIRRFMVCKTSVDLQLAVADKLAAMTRDELKAAAETFSFETSRCYVCGVTIQDRDNHTGLSTSCQAKGLGFQ